MYGVDTEINRPRERMKSYICGSTCLYVGISYTLRKLMRESAEKTGSSQGKAKLDIYLAYNLHKINSTWLKDLTMKCKTSKLIKRQYQKQCL